MNRRSLFRTLFASLAAPLAAKALPTSPVHEVRRFNADGSMTFWRDEIVPVITETRCPIVISKFHEAEFVFTTEELSMDEFIKRYPNGPSKVVKYDRYDD